MTFRTLRMMAVLLALIAFAMPASAQQYTGRIDVTVQDATGAVLPGVTVEVTGQLNTTAVTDARGEAHILNLPVGNYQVKATLAGFNEYKNPNVLVVAGGSVPLTIKMGVAGTQETVQVTAETPVIDTKKVGTTTSVNLEELQNVPSARDPWVVMQTVPGVVMDRVNIGGSESGQQSGFITKGASSSETTWNVDGMPVTDMSSMSSPFYFDFDMFQEMSFTTGGADSKTATSGMQLNMMLKSGTNNFHGQVKGYIEDPDHLGWMQSNNMPADLAARVGSVTGKGDRTNMFLDTGGDIGGPILKDKWWFWAAYGKQDIRITKMIGGVKDRTYLTNGSLKTNAQLAKNLRGSFTFFQANKQKWGRNAGAYCDQDCSVDQDGPNQFFKGEVNYNIGNNLFLVGRYAHVKGGFTFTPEGGNNTIWYDAGGVQHGSSWAYDTNRPQDTVSADGNYFRGNHEVKFGFTWRKATTTSSSSMPNDYYSIADFQSALTCTPGVGGCMGANIGAPYFTGTSAKYMNFYVGDTITFKRATLNAGVRFDHEAASVLAITMPSPKVPGAPAAYTLPAVTAPPITDAIKYNVVQPRVGLTYAVTEDRKTQLRASYAMFTNQISTGAAGFMSVAQYRWFYLDAIDSNGDGKVQPGEILWNTYQAHIDNGDFGGFNGSNPTALATAIHSIGNYGTPRTHEFEVGVDRELIKNLAVSATYTYRRNMDYNWRPIKQVGGDGIINGLDYVQTSTCNTANNCGSGSLPTDVPGSPTGAYSVPYYALKGATVGGVWTGTIYDPSKGTIYESRPDYHQTYKGFEVTATKRMADHWMARLGFSTNSWREYFSLDGIGNPTPTLGSPQVNGGYVVSAAGGSGKSNIYMVQPSYQLNASGVYQFKYDINLGLNYQWRQGYPMPWYRDWAPASGTTNGQANTDKLGGTKSMLLVYPDFGLARLPAVNIVDFRVGKTQKLGNVMLNFDFDVFNLTNAAEALGRYYSQTKSTYPNIQEITQPRIMRFGLRIQF